MALVTCAGADVLGGSIHLVSRGAWWAKLRLDTATAPTGSVTIKAVGGLSLAGYVTMGGVAYDVAHVQVVGGAGGLSKILKASAYENAQLRDPLGYVAQQTGESVSSTISSSITGAQLGKWTIVASSASRALDELCGAAGAAVGSPVTWRVLGDGTLWMGVETWSAASLPSGSDVLEVFPGEGRYVIGADTPSLLPGVNLSGVGQVVAVDHWLSSHEVRSWAWI